MRVLLTGNNEYIGKVLTKELLRKNYEVISYDVDYFYTANRSKHEIYNPTFTKYGKIKKVKINLN